MIKIDNGEIHIEGALGELITEAARLLDSIAKTIDKRSGDDEVDYGFVMNAVLEQVAHLADNNYMENLWDEKQEIDFFKQAQKIRHTKEPGKAFIDFDSAAQTPKPGKTSFGLPLKDTTSISGGVALKVLKEDNFYIDPRAQEDDLLDLDEIKKRKKNG